MLPVVEGVIERRVLINFRADPAVTRKLVPEPLEISTKNGFAVVGICLIRLERLRIKGFPECVGLSSENMAHRVAIRFPAKHGRADGVYIWRRETDCGMVSLLGGRLFPGVHGQANFKVRDDGSALGMIVSTTKRTADVSFEARRCPEWQTTALFQSFDEVCEFFRKGDCGFSCSMDGERLEGMQLRALKWQMSPLEMLRVQSAFFDANFPAGSIEFDGAVLMQGIPHEWHSLDTVPELATAKSS